MLSLHRTRVSLNVNKYNAPAVLALAKAIYNALIADPTQFPSPVPALPVVLGQITAVETAQQAVATRARGTAAVRDAKLAVLVTSLEGLQTYVQGLCDASPEQALSIVTAAAMIAKKPPIRSKAELAAKLGAAMGIVRLDANRKLLTGKTSKRFLFNWEYSLDGGKTWVAAPATPLANTEIGGLPPLTVVFFRVSATVGTVVGPWSQSVALLVR